MEFPAIFFPVKHAFSFLKSTRKCNRNSFKGFLMSIRWIRNVLIDGQKSTLEIQMETRG